MQYTVEVWPTLKLFREGRAYEYVGPMDKQQMIGYMKEQEKSPSDEKTTYTSEEDHFALAIIYVKFVHAIF